MDKTDLINKLRSLPAYTGMEIMERCGFGQYRGGMADTWNWNLDKLMDASKEQLVTCINAIEALIGYEKTIPKRVYTDQELKDQKTMVKTKVGYMSLFEKKEREKFAIKMEMNILGIKNEEIVIPIDPSKMTKEEKELIDRAYLMNAIHGGIGSTLFWRVEEIQKKYGLHASQGNHKEWPRALNK